MGDLVEVKPPVFHMLYNTSQQYKHATLTIDCMYRDNPQCAASYLLWSRHKDRESTMRAAIVDNNTSKALGHIDAEFSNKLKNCGLGYENVKYIIVTHIHLDHAGATGHLLRKCPNAIVLCHPKAVKHLIDPSRLIEAATGIYGKSRFEDLYGEILPCEKERVQAVRDNETVDFAEGRSLQFFHVDGHAKHHLIAFDKATESVFAGDAYGIRYPWLPLFNVTESLIFPSSSPSDFNAAEQRKAIEKIFSLQPRKIYITHYGMIEDIDGTKAELLKNLDIFEEIQKNLSKKIVGGMSEQGVVDAARHDIKSFFLSELTRRGLANDKEGFWDFFEHDVDINSKGLLVAAQRDAVANREEILEAVAREKNQVAEKPENFSVQEKVASIDLAKEEKATSLTVTELQEEFLRTGLEPYSSILQKQEIDGDIFRSLTKGDINAVFPNLSFGARFRMEKLQERLQQLQSSSK